MQPASGLSRAGKCIVRRQGPPYSGAVMRYTIMVVLCLLAGAAMVSILWIFLRHVRRIETELWEARKAVGRQFAGKAENRTPPAHPESEDEQSS